MFVYTHETHTSVKNIMFFSIRIYQNICIFFFIKITFNVLEKITLSKKYLIKVVTP